MAFEEFVRSFPGPTPRASMLAIDRLLHTFHHESTAPTRPAGINVIEGTLEQVLDFLHALTYGTPAGATPMALGAPARNPPESCR